MRHLIIALSLAGIFHFNFQQDTLLLFDGFSLSGWDNVDFIGRGNIRIADSCIILEKGQGITGIRWTKDFPEVDYEVSLEAKRVDGEDFFCGLTFPVKSSFNTLVIGGWGGNIVGLSCIDDEDAANNISYYYRKFEMDHWYKISLRVTDKKIEAWIDDENIVDFTIGDHILSVRWEMESSVPVGIASWQTTGAIRNIKLTKNIK